MGDKIFYKGCNHTFAKADTQPGNSAAKAYRYTPYGEQTPGNAGTKEISGTGENGLLYNGEAYDSVTGLIYLRARWYNPFICTAKNTKKVLKLKVLK